MSRQHFTSESVSAGHPDKLADQISDTLLDAFLAHDPKAKVACETFVANELVVIGGEARATPPDLVAEIKAHAPALIRQLLWDIGYRSNIPAIDPENCAIQLALNEQSDDIHRGVERADGVIGAGDQGLMFGYACDETPELMPLPIQLAHKLMQRHAEVRRSGALPWLRPDAKTQVTVRYEDDNPVDIATVVLSSQHAPRVSQKKLRQAIIEEIVEPVIPAALRAPDIIYRINPTGRFITGGPKSDAGLTGRKIIVDTYGGRCPHGGGAFSGKDPTKVDRSAAYMTRYIAKNIVAAKLARRCTVQLAYAIGVPDPVSICVDLHGTGDVDSTELEAAVPKLFDLSPKGIIDTLDLRRPIYAQTAVYGHFGRELEDFTWERVDKAELLAERFKPRNRPARPIKPVPAIKPLLTPLATATLKGAS